MATGGSTTAETTGAVLFDARTDGGAIRRMFIKNAEASENNVTIIVQGLHNANQGATLVPGQSDYFEVGGRVNGIEKITASGVGGDATVNWYACSKA